MLFPACQKQSWLGIQAMKISHNSIKLSLKIDFVQGLFICGRCLPFCWDQDYWLDFFYSKWLIQIKVRDLLPSRKILSYTCKQTQPLPTLLGHAGSCCDSVGSDVQQLPTILGPAVYRGKDTTHKTLETMCNARGCPDKYWMSCSNGSSIRKL